VSQTRFEKVFDDTDTKRATFNLFVFLVFIWLVALDASIERRTVHFLFVAFIKHNDVHLLFVFLFRAVVRSVLVARARKVAGR
jgi:hypothetical protein